MVIDENVEIQIENLERIKEERFQLRRKLFKYLRENIDNIDERFTSYHLNWLKRKMRLNYMSDINDTKLIALLRLFKAHRRKQN